MPRKGMRSIFFKPSISSSSPSVSLPSSSPCRSFSDSVMEEKIDTARTLIAKWDSDQSTYAKISYLFNGNRDEATEFLNAVRDLQSAMQYLVAQDSTSEKLVEAQLLMRVAMKRLEKEFYQILAANRDHIDPESVSVSTRSSTTERASISDYDEEYSEDELRVSGDAITEMERVSRVAMADLKAIADCMISSGYGKECINVYKIMRKSIVDEALYKLGVERLDFSQVQKLDWEVLELKIMSWLNAVKVAVRTLFSGERILCDYVFATSGKIAESCFAEIAKEGAMTLFGFPELVAKCKKTPEKMFRTLDLYEAMSDNWPQIESIFSYESTSTVKSQALSSLLKLGEAVRKMLADFETAIQKESSKTKVPGGGVHPLTKYVMNSIAFLADYSGILADIVADSPLTLQSPLPESYFPSPSPGENSSPEISVRLAWLILVLLCKLDGKAEYYKDVALSYLFLANNLQYVVVKVRTSNLSFLLGEEWLTRHEAKVKEYISKYERVGWSKVFSALPENSTAGLSAEKAAASFKSFNAAFHEACEEQISWVVSDPKLRDDVKLSICSKLEPMYRDFYEKNRIGLRPNLVVKFTPDDIGTHLSNILCGRGDSGSFDTHSASSSRRPIRLRWRFIARKS